MTMRGRTHDFTQALRGLFPGTRNTRQKEARPEKSFRVKRKHQGSEQTQGRAETGTEKQRLNVRRTDDLGHLWAAPQNLYVPKDQLAREVNKIELDRGSEPTVLQGKTQVSETLPFCKSLWDSNTQTGRGVSSLAWAVIGILPSPGPDPTLGNSMSQEETFRKHSTAWTSLAEENRPEPQLLGLYSLRPGHSQRMGLAAECHRISHIGQMWRSELNLHWWLRGNAGIRILQDCLDSFLLGCLIMTQKLRLKS